MARGGNTPVEQVSTRKLFGGVTDQRVAWVAVSHVPRTLDALGPIPAPGELRGKIGGLLAGVWTDWLDPIPDAAAAQARQDDVREIGPCQRSSGSARIEAA